MSIKENWIGWVGVVLVLVGYYLNANKFSESWIVWIIGNLMVGLYSYKKEAYPTAAMSFILVIVSIYGYLNWIK